MQWHWNPNFTWWENLIGMVIVGGLLGLAYGLANELQRWLIGSPTPQSTEQRPFTVAHDRALHFLSQHGSAEPDNPEQERILADLVAAGFARKQGSAYVYSGNSPAAWVNSTRRLRLVPPQAEMIWAGLACLGLVICVGWYLHSSSRSTAPDAIFAQASPAVVQVVIQDRQGRIIGDGSGFLVSRSGLIVTNHHVIDEAHSAHVVAADNTKLPVLGVAALNEEADLAIIKVAGKLRAHPLELAGHDLPPVGAKVYAIGNPLGRFSNTLSDGLVSGHREKGALAEFPRMPTLIQTTAPISLGSSGGPLLGADGNVVGVTTLASPEGQNINLAIPASHVVRLLRQCEEKSQLRQFPLARQPDPFTYIRRGNASLQKKEYEKALELFGEAIRLDPTFAFAYFCRGYTWSLKGNYDRAIWDYDDAIRLDPKRGGFYAFRGDALSSIGDHDRAIRDYDEAIRLDPNCELAYNGREIARWLKNDKEKLPKRTHEWSPVDVRAAKAEATSARIHVTVPLDAEIWVEGRKMSQTGTLRAFVSPPLKPGNAYEYSIRVLWTKNGRRVTKWQVIRVRAGEVISLRFSD